MRVSHLRPLRLTAAVGATLIASSMVVTPNATADPAPTGQPATVAPPTAITLITGDTVLLSTNPDGTQSATVEAAKASSTAFQTTRGPDGDVYLYPDTAVPALASGLVDRDLFNLTELAKQGLDDRHSAVLPVIADYSGRPVAGTLAARAQALPGSDLHTALPRLGYAGIEVDKARAAEFWRSLRPGSGIDKVWLDGRAEAVLDESVPLIGAPQVWATGVDGTGVKVAVLDTGIDAAHPDVAGRIAAAQSFVPDQAVQDGHGHGTHVGSTIVGSGAASQGRFKGVAPGAQLLVGKVLDNGGSGLDTWILAGMEWAVAQGADVVSMSLGAGPTDGTDALSQAVNRLSAESDTLFVIAAGNFGGTRTVAAPGSADAALTVGAFDKQDQLAGFSSRGPRLGDGAIKPEITAPGVTIAAARAAGTTMPNSIPVDDFYTRVSGTSMATPHVAGVAALLAQKRPGWTGEQLKDALSSTARTSDQYDPFQQGNGRVDAVRATAQGLYGSATADFGLIKFPQTDLPPQVRTVTYTNARDADVALDLDLAVNDADGQSPPDGMLALSADSVTVPAGGQASVTVTVDPTLGTAGQFTGYLKATGGDVAVTTAVAFAKEPPSFDLTVNVFGREGLPPRSAIVNIQNLADPNLYFEQFFIGGTTQFVARVPVGQYSVHGGIFSADPAGSGFFYATDMFAQPQVTVASDVSTTVDAREARDIEFDISQESRPLVSSLMTQTVLRRSANGIETSHAFVSASENTNGLHGAIPSGGPVEVGQLFYTINSTLRQPLLRASVSRPEPSQLFTMFPANTGRLDGVRNLPLVFVGAGQPADYDGVAVRGAVVLARANSGLSALATTAQARGAAALLVMQSQRQVLAPFVAIGTTLPVLATTFDEGQRLLGLLRQGPVSLRLAGVPESRYQYRLRLHETSGIPDDLSRTVDRSDLAQVTNTFHSDVASRKGLEALHSFAPWESFSVAFARDLVQPVRQTEWVSAGPDKRYMQQVWAVDFFGIDMIEPVAARYSPGQRVGVSWFRQPYAPTESPTECGFCRTATGLRFFPAPHGDGEPGHFGGSGSTVTRTMFRDGQLVTDPARLLVPEQATYRIEDVATRATPGVTMSPETRTAWTFRSAAPESGQAGLPVILLGYDLPLDELNRAPAANTFTFVVRAQRPRDFAGPSATAGLRASVSFDDGATWRTGTVNQRADGSYRVRVTHPPLNRTNGFVALRVEAFDSLGNRTAQTILRAYGLTG